MEGELSSEESNVFPFSSKKFEQYISNSISKKKKTISYSKLFTTN